MATSRKDIEANVKARDAQGPRVTLADAEALIIGRFFFTAEDGVLGQSQLGTAPNKNFNLDQAVFCTLVLKNGTRIVGTNFGPQDRKDFSRVLAEKLAYEQALDQVFCYANYALREKLREKAIADWENDPVAQKAYKDRLEYEASQKGKKKGDIGIGTPAKKPVAPRKSVTIVSKKTAKK